MIRSAALAVTTALAIATLVEPSHADQCDGSANDGWVGLECDTTTSESGETNSEGATASDTVSTAYRWVPYCGHAAPNDPNAGDVNCAGAQNCADPRLIVMALFSIQMRNGVPAGPWQFERIECRDPTTPDNEQVRTLTPADVLSAVRRVGLPVGEVETPAYTLVNLETTFFTEPQHLDRTLEIIGFTVRVQAEPVGYTWHWGDGTTTETDTPGRRYPSTDITHTYVHATDDGDRLALSVDVTYAARYSVDGATWIDIPETITIDGPTTSIPIKQASSVLTQPQ